MLSSVDNTLKSAVHIPTYLVSIMVKNLKDTEV